MVEGNSSASITTTYNNLMKRCNNALTYTAAPYTDKILQSLLKRVMFPDQTPAIWLWHTGLQEIKNMPGNQLK